MIRITAPLIALSLLLCGPGVLAAQTPRGDTPRPERSGRRDVEPVRGGGQQQGQGQGQDEEAAQKQKRTPPISGQERRDVQRIDARGRQQGTGTAGAGRSQGGNAGDAKETPPQADQKDKRTPPITGQERRDVQRVDASGRAQGDAPAGRPGSRPAQGEKAGEAKETPARGSGERPAPRIDRAQARALMQEMLHHHERIAKIEKLMTVFKGKKDDPAAAAKLTRATELRAKENERHTAALARFREKMGAAEVDAVLARIKAQRERRRGAGPGARERQGAGAERRAGEQKPAGGGN